jgi:hypothetical protein
VDEEGLEVGVEAYRLDRRGVGTEPRAASPGSSIEECVGVVAAFGFVGERLDRVVGDRRAGAGVAMDWWLHRSSILR